jgi:hypothetical protein
MSDLESVSGENWTSNSELFELERQVCDMYLKHGVVMIDPDVPGYETSPTVLVPREERKSIVELLKTIGSIGFADRM